MFLWKMCMHRWVFRSYMRMSWICRNMQGSKWSEYYQHQQNVTKTTTSFYFSHHFILSTKHISWYIFVVDTRSFSLKEHLFYDKHISNVTRIFSLKSSFCRRSVLTAECVSVESVTVTKGSGERCVKNVM